MNSTAGRMDFSLDYDRSGRERVRRYVYVVNEINS